MQTVIPTIKITTVTDSPMTSEKLCILVLLITFWVEFDNIFISSAVGCFLVWCRRLEFRIMSETNDKVCITSI